MKERLFRFKQFAVAHSRSAMKVGVDGVLIGAWATPSQGSVLDVGCGCGLIAVMMAQRASGGKITGLDIHEDSVEEARFNVERSPWSDRVEIIQSDFSDFIGKCKMEGRRFDLIISNPPFFNAGVATPLTPREQARHQGSLTPALILTSGREVLTPEGKIALIVPSSEGEGLKRIARDCGLFVQRECRVRDHQTAPVKRVMIEFGLSDSGCDDRFEELVMFDESKEPTEAYRELCKEFYLRF